MKGSSIHAKPRSGPKRAGQSTTLDRALWTATGIALGAGLAIVANFIYFREAWM